jgi:hypothetical protein
MNPVDAERRLLATAVLDLANTRFALFSESCIPHLGFPAVYAYLTRSNTSAINNMIQFMQYFWMEKI